MQGETDNAIRKDDFLGSHDVALGSRVKMRRDGRSFGFGACRATKNGGFYRRRHTWGRPGSAARDRREGDGGSARGPNQSPASRKRCRNSLWRRSIGTKARAGAGSIPKAAGTSGTIARVGAGADLAKEERPIGRRGRRGRAGSSDMPPFCEAGGRSDVMAVTPAAAFGARPRMTPHDTA
ncbi:MAG: hypothetical protein AMXMBFR78_33180 [Rubrivivax sp.]